MIEPTVIYEDDEVVVINKPPGLLVHPDGTIKDKTLVDWIILKYPEIKGVGETLKLKNGEEIERPGIVHRLDRETSGIIVIAKTQESFLNLKEQFQNREIQKIYNAFVYGILKEDKGSINRSIGRSSGDFRKWSAQRGARGTLRGALTEYKVIERGKGHTFLELNPRTGRTHQIRVHLKAINHSVICDKLYAPKHPCDLGFERLALHAQSIEFNTVSGEKKSFKSPLPDDFKKALEKLKS